MVSSKSSELDHLTGFIMFPLILSKWLSFYNYQSCQKIVIGATLISAGHAEWIKKTIRMSVMIVWCLGILLSILANKTGWLEFLKRSSRTSREIENESCAGSASSQKEIFRDRPRSTDYDWKFTYTILITYFFATLFPKNKNKICEDCAICIKLTKRSEKSRAMDIFLLYAQSAYLPRIQFPVVIRVLAS